MANVGTGVGHPLLKFEQEINEFANIHFGDLGGFKNNSTVHACGIVASVKKKVDRRERTMAFIRLEDFSGRAECIVFADAYAKYQHLLQPDAMVMVTGKGELSGDILKIIVNEVDPMDKVREKFAKSIILSFNVSDVKENTIIQLRDLMEKSRGNCACYLNVIDSDSTRRYHTKRFTIDPSDEFVGQVRRILGPKSLRFMGQ